MSKFSSKAKHLDIVDVEKAVYNFDMSSLNFEVLQ